MKKIWVIKPLDGHFYGYLFQKIDKVFRVKGPQKISARDLKNEKVLLLIEDKEIYFQRETFTRGPQEIIALQINERLKNLGLAEQISSLAYRLEEIRGTFVDVSYLALLSCHVEDEIKQLISSEVRLCGIQHHAIALAGLSKFISQEIVLLVEVMKDGLWLVISQGENPLYLRYYAIPDSQELTAHKVEEALLAALDFAHRGLKKEVKKILPLGPKREIIPSLPHLKSVIPEGIPFENHQALFLEPAFFGALFAPKGFDLTPEEHRLWSRHLRPARYAALGFLFLALINFMGWFYFSRENRELHGKIEPIKQEVERMRYHFEKILTGQANNFSKFLEIEKRFSQEPRFDLFLAWLSQNLPPKAHLRSFNAQKKPSGFELTFEIICPGSFSEVQRAFRELSYKLDSQNDLKKSRLSYEEKEKRGIFTFEIIPHVP